MAKQTAVPGRERAPIPMPQHTVAVPLPVALAARLTEEEAEALDLAQANVADAHDALASALELVRAADPDAKITCGRLAALLAGPIGRLEQAREDLAVLDFEAPPEPGTH